jgi:hypothetical protein
MVYAGEIDTLISSDAYINMILPAVCAVGLPSSATGRGSIIKLSMFSIFQRSRKYRRTRNFGRVLWSCSLRFKKLTQ